MDEEPLDDDTFATALTMSGDSSTADHRTLPAADIRPPLEHTRALDAICAAFDSDDRVYVVTDSPTLLQAVVNRHDRLVTHEGVLQGVHVHEDQDVVTVPEGRFEGAVEQVLVLEPETVGTIQAAIDMIDTGRPHDCLVGNPFSFNQIEDRAVNAWLSPWGVRSAYEKRGFETEVVGYHGPRSILRSIVGRAWQAIDRPDRRDVYTHRMRATYREESFPLALLSCIVHMQARPEEG